MKIKFNNLVHLGLIFILCLSMTACYNGNAEFNSDADYKITSENGQNYIVFDESANYAASTQVLATISFNSLKEFKDTVTKGNLTESQKAQIAAAFPKDEKGNILTCDFENLYAPALPKDVSMGIVGWRGETYSFGFDTTDSVFGYLHYLTPSGYKELFNYEYETFFDRDLINVTETKDLGDGKTATYYTTIAGRFMRVRYTLSEGSKTCVIDKSYALEWYSLDEKVSSTVPYTINMYCSDAKTYYSVDMFEFTEDPTDEWLIQFGVTPYVETDAVVK